MPRKPSTKPRKPKGAKQLPNNLPIIQSTVRPQDTAARRYSTRSDVSNLLRRYAKWVKVAVGMRASGLAQLPVRWYRDGEGAGEKSMRWKSRRVKDRKRTKITDGGGPGTRKSMGYIDELEEITDPTFPGNLLMDRANPWMSGFAFMESIEAAGCMAGNAYGAMVIPPRVGYPTELWALPPQHVRIVPSTTDRIAGYQYGRGSEVERFYKPDEVIPFKRSSPRGDPWYGESDMESCLPDADLSFAMSQVALALLDNGIMPGLVFCGEDWTGDQRSEAREEFEREHQGVAKIGRSLFISGKVKIDKVQIGQYEVELLQGSDNHAREVVAACFGVPLEYMTLRPGGLGDGKGVAGDQFQRLTLLPSKQRIEDELNMYLVPHFRKAMGDDSLVLCIDSPVQEDETAMWARAGKAYTEGWVFRDEARSMASLDPVDDGKPVWGPQANAPVQPVMDGPGIDGEATDATDATTPKAPSTDTSRTLAADPAASVQDTGLNGAQIQALQAIIQSIADGQLPLAVGEPLITAAFPLIPPEKVASMLNPLRNFEPKQPEPTSPPAPGASSAGRDSPKPDAGGDPSESGKALEPSVTGTAVAAAPGSLKALIESHTHGRKAAPGDIVPASTEFRKAMQDFFDAWSGYTGNAVTSAIRMGEAVGVTFTEAPILYGNDEAFRELAERITRESMKPHLSGHNNAAGVLIGDGKAGDVVPWKTVPGDAEQFLRDNAEGTADGVLRNYDQSVRSAVSRELADTLGGEALTTEKLNAAVARAIPGVNQAKAVQIAESETTRAFSAGQKRAFDDSPFTSGYEWVCGSEPCPFCESLGGKIVDKSEGFLELGGTLSVGDSSYTNDYEAVEHPPLHPACICYLRPVYKPEAGAIQQ